MICVLRIGKRKDAGRLGLLNYARSLGQSKSSSGVLMWIVSLRSILFLLLMLRPDCLPSCTTSGNDNENGKTPSTSCVPTSSSCRGSRSASGPSCTVHMCATFHYLAIPFVCHQNGKLL